MPTFWDFCAPFYDFAEKANGRAYANMLKCVQKYVPHKANVIEIACGTGAISMAVAKKAESVLCADISDKMLSVARRKAKRIGVLNIEIANANIYDTKQQENSFDVVIAGQVLHLLDNPSKASYEIRRVAKHMVIMPMSFTRDLRGLAKFLVSFYRMLGFAPKIEFDMKLYEKFLIEMGFDNCEIITIAGRIPMAVAVWFKVEH